MSDDPQNRTPEAGQSNGCLCIPGCTVNPECPDHGHAADVAKSVILASQGRGDDGRMVAGCPPLNPGGRPKTKMMRDALLKYFKQNPSALDKIIETAAEKAMAGDYQYFRELRDMVDGKPATAITGEDGGALEVNVTDARTKLVQDLM
jgi:hypothetical protein